MADDYPGDDRVATAEDAERVITVQAAHLCEDGLDYANWLVEMGSNHGRLPFGWMLLVPEAEQDTKPDCPASLRAVFDGVRALGCAWVIIDDDGGGLRLEGLPVYAEDEEAEEPAPATD